MIMTLFDVLFHNNDLASHYFSFFPQYVPQKMCHNFNFLFPNHDLVCQFYFLSHNYDLLAHNLNSYLIMS